MRQQVVRTDGGKVVSKLAEFIRYRRRELGMSQLQLGLKVGYRYGNAIAMLERGLMIFPFGNAIRFADALDIPRHEFLELVFKELYPEFADYAVFRPAPTITFKRSSQEAAQAQD